jgi:hypothetical protein
MSIAYALREDFKGTVEVFDTVEDQQAGNGREQRRYLGGLIAVADERDFDPLAELTIAGNGDADAGIIVVADADHALIAQLDAQPALKRVPVPEDATEVAKWEGQPVLALRDELERRGLDKSGVKADLVARLEASDAAIAGGDQETAADPNPEQAGDGQEA